MYDGLRDYQVSLGSLVFLRLKVPTLVKLGLSRFLHVRLLWLPYGKPTHRALQLTVPTPNPIPQSVLPPLGRSLAFLTYVPHCPLPSAAWRASYRRGTPR
jgi:hypothetical protein